MLGIVPLHSCARDEQLRDALAIEVCVNRRIGIRAERAKEKQYMLLIDQLARLLDCSWRAIPVIPRYELDPAPVHATFGIHLCEIGGLRASNGAIGGSG